MVDIPDFLQPKMKRTPSVIGYIKAHLGIEDALTANICKSFQTDKGYFVVNELRDDLQVIEWVKAEFLDKVDDIQDIWVKENVQVVPSPLGSVNICKTQISEETPIIKSDWAHIFFIRSSDVNYLNYIQYEINKRVENRKKLDKILGSSNRSGEQVIKDITEELANSIKQLMS